MNTSSDSVFLTPQKAWRAEELERNLLSASSKEQSSNVSTNNWPQSPQTSSSNQNLSNKVTSQRYEKIFPGNAIHYHNKMNQRVFTREEVERQLHSDSRIGFSNKVGNLQSPLQPPLMRSNMIPPVGSGLVCIFFHIFI